jgi:hypothetical protein
MRMLRCLAVIAFAFFIIARRVWAGSASVPVPIPSTERPIEISGRYPQLAMFNHQGECGVGAVAPWAGRLWVVTYAPHKPEGSDDRLYEIEESLHRTVRPESVGGTPADRLIHRESKQLIIGPYFIDEQRHVRALDPKQTPGRLTAAARHLSDPAHRIYLLDMEGTLYDVDAQTLAATKVFDRVAPGAHAKGAYTGQGRLFIANNGATVVNKTTPALDDPDYAKDLEAAGILAGWDGKTWSAIERRQFTDVTGPGGIEGATDAAGPLWSIGWDRRSVILKLLDGGKWSTYRLPVADYSYVAAHGWYTEWPRIREVGGGKMLLNMHGGWFEFPKGFSIANTAGIRPIGDHLKMTGDFCEWRGRIVFGCDDNSILENPLSGQSQSNLWFTKWDDLAKCGRPAGYGGPWVNDSVRAGVPSDPYLLAGYSQRVLHVSHDADDAVTFNLEVDADGSGHWSALQSMLVPAHSYAWHVLPSDLTGQWIRITSDHDATGVTAYFHYGPGGGATEARNQFAAIVDSDAKAPWSGGTLRPLGGDSGTLLFNAHRFDATDQPIGQRLLEISGAMQYQAYAGKMADEPKSKGAADAFALEGDEASLILVEGGKRFRLPRAQEDVTPPGAGITPRAIREVVTERFLLNAGGSFFVLPRPSAGGAVRLKPISTHRKRITDYCSWRGLVAIAGTRTSSGGQPDGHYFSAGPNNAGLWFGDVDDLWKLGKPVGHGGPWLKTQVGKDEASDPYLMLGYDHKTLSLSHDTPDTVLMTLEVDIRGDGAWHPFNTFEVPAGGQPLNFEFPQGYSVHWIRLRCDTACKATAQLNYD